MSADTTVCRGSRWRAPSADRGQTGCRMLPGGGDKRASNPLKCLNRRRQEGRARHRLGYRSLNKSNSALAAWISPPAGPWARGFGFQA